MRLGQRRTEAHPPSPLPAMAFWRAEEEDRVRREKEEEEKAAAAAEQQPIIGKEAAAGSEEEEATHFVFRRSDDQADAAAAAAVADAAAASAPAHYAAASSSSSLPVPGSLPLPSLTPKRRQLGGSRSPSHNEGSRSGSGSASQKDRDDVGGLAASPRQMGNMLLQANSRTASQDPTTISQVRYFEEPEPSPQARRQMDGERPGAAFPLLARTVSEDESAELAMLREVDATVCEAAAAAASSSSSSSSSSELLFPILKYGSYEARLATFRGARRWPHTLDSHPMLTPESMAKAGLFLCQNALEARTAVDEATGDFPADAVCCYSCGTLMHDWESMDEAERSHRNAANHCAFLEQLSLARAQQAIFNRLQSEEHAPGGMVVPAAIGSSGSMLQRLLQGGADDASSVSPRQAMPEASAPDADSDDLPPLQSSTGVSANLVRSHSVREKQQIEIPETESQRHRALVSTNNASVTIQDTTVELFKRVEGEQKDGDVGMGLGVEDAESVPVTVQVRAPLVPFTAEDPAVSLLQPQAASLLYFQIKIVRFAGGEFEGSAAAAAGSFNAGSASSNASGLSASGTFPPLVIGLSTSALHLGSLPPGFDPPVAPSLLNLGLTSSGELLLNGQGPLSGVVGMQSLPFCAPLGLRAGDIVGCKVDLERGVISWHVNGRRLGPVNIPLTEQEIEAAAAQAAGSGASSSSSSSGGSSITALDPAAPRASRFKALSSFSFYPTVSLLSVGDSVEFQLTTDAAIAAAKSFSSFSSMQMHGAGFDPAGPRDLLQRWQLCSESDQVALATGALADQAPDLGLVLDQTNLKTPAASAQQQRAAGNMSAPRLGAASPVYPVVISKILPGYAAQLAGLRVGDTLKLINGVPILALQDAVNVVRKCKPAMVLMFEVLRKTTDSARNGSVLPFVIPLTLGAKAMPMPELLKHAQWIQWSKDLLEWVGPPALLPPLAGVARQAALSPRGGSAASSPIPLQSPPNYVVGAPLPPSAIEHIKAMEIALVIERRMSYLKGSAVTNSIFLPEYRSLQKRVQSFNAQMQAWMAPRMPAASASASAGEVALLSSGGSTVAPKPVNVAMHGFVYAPLEGFPFRCICFACGLVLPVVRSVATLLEAHRQGARAAKQTALALRAPAMARPPSYHQDAELTPANLDTGCLFLTLYDSVSANLAEVARQNLLNKQKSKLAAPKAPSALAASSSAPSSSALSSSSSSSAAVASGPVPQVEVVIDVEAENDEADKLMGASSDAGGSSRMSTPMAKQRIGSGMVVANNENMVNGGGGGGAGSSNSSNMKLGMVLGASAGLALGGAAAVAALDPPPNYHVARLRPSVPVGPDLFKESSHEHDGIVYQAAGQVAPRLARVGEFDRNGDINLPGRPPLSAFDMQRRNQNRPFGQQVNRGGGGGDYGRHGGGGYAGNHDAGIELVALGHHAPAVPPPPPPPPQDPSVALREFFCPAGGSKLGLCWKIPFFIMVLPFFLVWETLRGLFNGCIWCCEKVTNLCERCCAWSCKMCEKYWHFLCVTVLIECFCKNLCDCLKWTCRQLDKYCCTPLAQCCDWLCTQLFDCCAWWHRNCCAPIGRAVSRCCRSVCNALSACCSWICRQCERACNAIGRCCAAICGAFGDCCSAICNALSRCCNATCDAMEKGLRWSATQRKQPPTMIR